MILGTDGVFRMAATNYQQAGSHLEEAEQELRKLLEKLETCLELMRNASGLEPIIRGAETRPMAVAPSAALENVEVLHS